MQNFIFIWGCRPSSGVDAETVMVAELAQMLGTKCNRDNMTIELPFAFQNMVGQDANFEMVTSNTIQPILLHYQHNVASHTIAYIFINTKCKDLDYKDIKEKKACMQDLFEDRLKFSDVKIFEDKSKKEILEIIGELRKKACDYET